MPTRARGPSVAHSHPHPHTTHATRLLRHLTIMRAPLLHNPQAPRRGVMSHHAAVSPPPPQEFHHDEKHHHRPHRQHLQYERQHHHVQPQFYQQYQQQQQQQRQYQQQQEQSVPHHADPSFSGEYHQQQQPPQQHFSLSCASSAFTVGINRTARVHAISPAAFLSDCRPGTQAGWTTSSGAADGMEGAGALGASTPRFLASHASSRTMPSSAPRYTTPLPSSFAAPSSPGHAQYFSSEPLIVSGPAGADGERGRGVAPASHPSYPLHEAMSGGEVQQSKRQQAPRDGHSDEQQSKRARTPETPVLNSKAFMTLNARKAVSTCQPGREGALVGLLPGLLPEYMQTYEKEEKKRRATREDLSMLTAEEKVERRKGRARVYSHQAWKRDEAKMQALVEDVDMMQVFRHIVDDAPDMIAVVSPDLDCTFLYANEAFERVLGFLAHRLLGRPLWALVHPEDHPALKQTMTVVILAPARNAVSAPLSCRMACATMGKYVSVNAKMCRGTQGIVCSFGEKAQ